MPVSPAWTAAFVVTASPNVIRGDKQRHSVVYSSISGFKQPRGETAWREGGSRGRMPQLLNTENIVFRGVLKTPLGRTSERGKRPSRLPVQWCHEFTSFFFISSHFDVVLRGCSCPSLSCTETSNKHQELVWEPKYDRPATHEKIPYRFEKKKQVTPDS